MHVLLEHTPFKFNCSRTQWVPAILQAGSLEHTMHAQASRLHRAGFELALVQCQPKLTPVELSTVVHREQAAESNYLLPEGRRVPSQANTSHSNLLNTRPLLQAAPFSLTWRRGVCTLIGEIAY